MKQIPWLHLSIYEGINALLLVRSNMICKSWVKIIKSKFLVELNQKAEYIIS